MPSSIFLPLKNEREAKLSNEPCQLPRRYGVSALRLGNRISLSPQGVKGRPRSSAFASRWSHGFLRQERCVIKENSQHGGVAPIRHPKHDMPKIRPGLKMNITAIKDTFENDSV